MNLNVCEKYCNINGVVLYRCGDIDIKLCNKSHQDVWDLPCQKYTFNGKKRVLNPKIKFLNHQNKDIRCGAYFPGDETTKHFKVSKSCPYYAEHLIYDEN